MLSPNDVDDIVRQIADGAAAFDSWSRRAAGGFDRPDDAREYFCHLRGGPGGGTGSPWRVARVTVYRDAAGRWTVGDIDIFAGPMPEDAGDMAAGIVAAVDADDRAMIRA